MDADVAILGGGPVGCVAALAFAARGASVVLLEANPKAATRLAGEWLHPPAVRILSQLGVDFERSTDLPPVAAAAHAHRADWPMGRGFVVFGDDGAAPIPLEYPTGAGFSLLHEDLVAALRRRVGSERRITMHERARALGVSGCEVTFVHHGSARRVRAGLIVGATGRSDVPDPELCTSAPAHVYSRMAGVVLHDVELPFEGYGHVFLGGLGPILGYRIGGRAVRLCLDVPLQRASTRDRALLYEGYAVALPEPLRRGLKRALLVDRLAWAINQTRPRERWGRPGFPLVGDAVGHHHPLTAVGMTLGFQDAVAVAEHRSFDDYRRERAQASRVSEMLALALYDVFTGTRDDLVAIRKAVYELWRTSPATRDHTMRLLAGEAVDPAALAVPFLRAAGSASKRILGTGVERADLSHTLRAISDLGARTRWLLGGAFSKAPARPAELAGVTPMRPAHDAETSDGDGSGRHAPRGAADGPDPSARALERGIGWLLAQQDADGSFEGECVWCAMLAAQYVLTWHVVGRPIDGVRRRRLLLHFERTRLPDGTWGLSAVSTASLFVTTLVFCAARVLGVEANDPLVARAHAFIVGQGVESIPTWGKFWLAILGLYEWEGMNPIPPELWLLPRAAPIHPRRYYCHTRMIYLAMSTLYGERFRAVDSPAILALRDELYPQGYANVDFTRARSSRRAEDLYAPVGRPLEATYAVLRRFERAGAVRARRKALAGARAAIRWELSVSSHSSISPVSGLLNIIALWSSDRNDADAELAMQRFESWLWEDDRDGTRVTGARSAIWDTSFALQALTLALPHADVQHAVARADRFLCEQQIRGSFAGWEVNARIDPDGGYPFSWRWHGWPVSDCTAEAMLARLEAEGVPAPSADDVVKAAAFVLRTQGAGGGFGSYEPPRVRMSLEWLNPAEMFGNSMTEHEYVECTASVAALLAAVRRRRPELLDRPELRALPRAIDRAVAFLRRTQRADGAWAGAWGVHFTYGTLFGIRGLLAAGVPCIDPGVRKACAWLEAHQRADGSWGELRDLRSSEYAEHSEGQVVQTSWALIALLEARHPNWDALTRGARFLAAKQLGSGEWPREHPSGIFFETALLDYALYRSYFPVWALGAYETRRKERADLAAPATTSDGVSRVVPVEESFGTFEQG